MVLYRDIVYLAFFVGGLQFEDDRPETVVTTTDGHARFAYPIAVVEQFFRCAVGQRKYILVNRFPSLVAKSVGFGIVCIKHLSFAEHRAGP